MTVIEQIKEILASALQLEQSVFSDDTNLLGAIPEFDSITVITVITELEDTFDIQFSDDEISAEVFENFGNLNQFISERVNTI